MRDGSAYEFSAIRNYPHVETQHIPTGKRLMDVMLYFCGKKIGQCTKVYRRNRCVETHYMVNGEFLGAIALPLMS